MKPIALTGLALAAILAAGGAGYWAGHRGLAVGWRGWLGIEGSLAANEPVGTGPVIYYQDPDRKPVYSAQPRQTVDGRPFTAVHASQDVSFEVKPPSEERTAQADPKRVLYYRNPMGLPDTSPVPKKDSMGMDYLPVYEGEGNEDGVIKLSPGRIQRSGVRSEPVRRQSIVQTIHVPGVVQLDERRVSVVTIRADAFVQEVAPITTGDRVTRGTRLARIYSPEISTAGAQFITELNAAARGVPEGGARQRLENLGVPPEVIAEIERSRKVPLTINWSAPRDGIVLERSVSDGMKMTAGGSLFRLADISTIWVLADVPERQLAAVGIGAVAGHLQHMGYGDPFWRFVAGHAPLELTAIVIAGGAGLQLGLRLIAPGRKRRIDALVEGGVIGARLCLGVAFMLLLAAFVEAFWSSIAAVPAWGKFTVSGVLWALVFGWLWRGGHGGGDAH